MSWNNRKPTSPFIDVVARRTRASSPSFDEPVLLAQPSDCLIEKPLVRSDVVLIRDRAWAVPEEVGRETPVEFVGAEQAGARLSDQFERLGIGSLPFQFLLQVSIIAGNVIRALHPPVDQPLVD